MAPIEKHARTIAALDGGKIANNGETRAYQTGRREGWWRYGRGVFNGDCVSVYSDKHWPDYIGRAQMVHS